MFVAATARGQDHVAFGLDWKAEAEYGGYYQALATGLYAKRGLNVAIEEGGPQVNHMMLFMAGRLDFNLGGGGRSSSPSNICRFSPWRRFFRKISRCSSLIPARETTASRR